MSVHEGKGTAHRQHHVSFKHQESSPLRRNVGGIVASIAKNVKLQSAKLEGGGGLSDVDGRLHAAIASGPALDLVPRIGARGIDIADNLIEKGCKATELVYNKGQER